MATETTTATARPGGRWVLPPRPARPGRRGWLLVGGLLAMVVCAGLFTLVYLGADARVPALAVARPVAAGQTVSAEDLRVVRIVPDAGVELVPAATLPQVVGRRAAVPLAEGTLLSHSQLGPAVWPPPGRAVAAVRLEPGRLPAGVTAGSRVLVAPAAPDATVDPAGVPEGTAQPVPATVVQVVETADGSGAAVVSLLLDQADAIAVAGAQASSLALVLAGG